MTSVLVTGASGFIGRRVAAACLEAGFRVVTTSRSPAPGEWVEADLTEAPLELPRVDWVLHLAGGPAAAGYDALVDTDLRIATNLVCWGLRENVQGWVFAGAAEVYGDCPEPVTEAAALRPELPYATVKLCVEGLFARLAHQVSDSCVVTLRIGKVYGPEGRLVQELARRLRGGFCPWFGDGRVPVSFVHVDDVASAFVAAVQRAPLGYSVINVAGGEPATWRDFVVGFADLLDTRHPVALPIPLAQAYARASEARDRVLRRSPVVTRNVVGLLTTPSVMSNEALRRRLGVTPSYRNVAEGLAATHEALVAVKSGA